MGDNTRIIDKWHGYYLEDINCKFCLYFKRRKIACGIRHCRFDEEKQDAFCNGRVSRKRGVD